MQPAGGDDRSQPPQRGRVPRCSGDQHASAGGDALQCPRNQPACAEPGGLAAGRHPRDRRRGGAQLCHGVPAAGRADAGRYRDRADGAARRCAGGSAGRGRRGARQRLRRRADPGRDRGRDGRADAAGSVDRQGLRVRTGGQDRDGELGADGGAGDGLGLGALFPLCPAGADEGLLPPAWKHGMAQHPPHPCKSAERGFAIPLPQGERGGSVGAARTARLRTWRSSFSPAPSWPPVSSPLPSSPGPY